MVCDLVRVLVCAALRMNRFVCLQRRIALINVLKMTIRHDTLNSTNSLNRALIRFNLWHRESIREFSTLSSRVADRG